MPEKINKLLGTDISKEEMIGYFKKIDLELMKRQAKSSHLLSVMTYSASLTLRKRLQDSTDMITFLPHFQVVKLQQENYHSS